MKTKTKLITDAFREYSRAIEHHFLVTKGIRVRILGPRVLYIPGKGYEINGRLVRRPAKRIIKLYYNKAARLRNKAEEFLTKIESEVK